jgi:lysophospholipase L1-like esterase
VSTSVQDQVTRTQDQAPDWSPIAPPPERSPSSAAVILRRLAGAAVVVALLILLGHGTAALILLAVMAVVNVACAVSPPVARAVRRVENAIEGFARRVLGPLLMGGLNLIVFTPIWLVLRLVRHDTLAAKPVSEGSFWTPVPSTEGKPLYRRQFAYEREPKSARPSKWMRVRAALGVVLVIALLDVIIGATIDRLDTESTGTSLFVVGNAAAGPDQRSFSILQEVVKAAAEAPYDPYLGWRVADFHGRYVNIENGVRRTKQAPGANAPDALKVYFFGGSAMFGAFQADAGTIASQFAKLAAADGIHVKVVNYGQTAYVNRQEVLLLEQLLVAGKRPDLAVFYDGFNDLMNQFASGPYSRPTTLEAEAIRERLARGAVEPDPSLYRAWSDASALHRLGRSLGLLPQQDESGQRLVLPWNGDQMVGARKRGRLAVELHARQVDLAQRLARSYNIQAAYFWQPTIYTKNIADGEENYVKSQGADPEAWRLATQLVRERMKPPVVDLGDSLDDLTQPVMYDFVHTNEAGAAAIAEALYERLRPQLQLLYEAKSR